MTLDGLTAVIIPLVPIIALGIGIWRQSNNTSIWRAKVDQRLVHIEEELKRHREDKQQFTSLESKITEVAQELKHQDEQATVMLSKYDKLGAKLDNLAATVQDLRETIIRIQATPVKVEPISNKG